MTARKYCLNGWVSSNGDVGGDGDDDGRDMLSW
jgi:hypothetical protein